MHLFCICYIINVCAKYNSFNCPVTVTLGRKAQVFLEEVKAKPFLRWAGGKNWLLPYLDKLNPVNFNDYHEPFLGGGSVFFHLRNGKGKYYLSDLNEDLISTYQAIQKNAEAVIEELLQLQNTKEFYYNIRDKKFRNPFKKAARFIYLNKTSFNGLYRVNQNGKYNVPYGFRKKFEVDHSNIRAVKDALVGVQLKSQDFITSLEKVKPKDLVFVDPPYTVAHENNGFILYNQKLFTLQDQKKLAAALFDISKRGGFYILTNAKHDALKEIYCNLSAPIEVKRQSLIGGRNASRGLITEYLFTNIQP